VAVTEKLEAIAAATAAWINQLVLRADAPVALEELVIIGPLIDSYKIGSADEPGNPRLDSTALPFASSGAFD
jgi:hypothetical protein